VGILKLRKCTHCKNGEVFIDHDLYGWYESCLQCGYNRDLPDIAQPVTGDRESSEKDRRLVKKADR
jgi:hypothetical protein